MRTATDKPERWAEISARKPRLLRPAFAVNWAGEWLAYWLGRWALIELLQLLATFSIPVGVYSYLHGADDRRRERHYQAWQVINSAQGKGGNGGRLDALEDLNRADDRVSLDGVNLRGAWLDSIDLSFAEMRQASLDSTSLLGACLRGARFLGSRFRGADLGGADLRDAELDGTDFTGAILMEADLRSSHVAGVLESANVIGADLRKAVLNRSRSR